ncbi:IS3 family transposase [Streptomyces rhizosphaerihabitans]|uniref:IS3 family transposase n=1 Tax=Streptomyces rhizosphaerihabitans TaxID=1266770 RepID=UPI00370456E3
MPRHRADRADRGDPHRVRRIHGSRRVRAVLRREGTRVGRKRVERLMREADLEGTGPRRTGFTRRDPKATPAPDPVGRDSIAPAPNRLWVTGLTMISTGEGPLRLSAVRDAFSRRVVAPVVPPGLGKRWGAPKPGTSSVPQDLQGAHRAPCAGRSDGRPARLRCRGSCHPLPAGVPRVGP